MQKRLLIQPIQDQVFNEVQKIGKNKRYDFIFDKSADVVMLYSEKRHDISDLILRAIARTRKVSAPNKKNEKALLKQYEAEQEKEEMSDALKERKTKSEQATEARESTAEGKRAEQLKLREERKKAYEERRRKLIEEREAKRKVKLDERKKASETEPEAAN